MSVRLLKLTPLGLVLLLAMGMFLSGIDWGLPSHAADRFLFGDRPVWPGAKIYALSGGWDADAALGADVARHPLERSEEGGGPVVVNGDDADRARIMQRYRLYSAQPDEMITFRALSGIDARHGKLDPKLYQYGGLWIYGVGGMLAAAKALGAITVRRDVAFYLDHPEAFGRFYIVARLYAVLGGLVLVSAVYGLMRQMGSRRMWAAIGAAAVAMMPVVVNAAHEAKPHLPGAALVMLVVWAGSEYAHRGRSRWLLACGTLCGAAMGMVLWAGAAFVVIVAAVLIRASIIPSEPGSATPVLASPDAASHQRRKNPAAARRRGALVGIGALALGACVYAITNPYVVIHLLHDPAVLRSNLQNTSNMYGIHSSAGAVANAVSLIGAGMSPIIAIAGLVGAIALGARGVRGRSGGCAAAWRGGEGGSCAPEVILLATVAIVMAVPYVALAAGKPAEYGRFALVPDVVLAMAAMLAIETFARRRVAIAAMAVLLATVAFFGIRYTAGFIRDAGPDSSRMVAAKKLAALPGDRLAIAAEPAPYCLPPVDLFRWKLLLAPKWDEADGVGEVSCRAVDDDWATPLSWADKRFLISAK